jgi:hypothetical protein
VFEQNYGKRAMSRVHTTVAMAIIVTTVTFALAAHASIGIGTQQALEKASNLVANPPAEYLSCLSNSGCRVAHSSCGTSRAINQSHVDQYEAAVASIAPNIDCPNPKTSPAYIAECENKICTLKAQ